MVDINDHFISIIRTPLKVDGDGASVKPVPTHHNIDTSSLTSEGLQALKNRDPFLYYSIPGVRAAARLNEKLDISSMETTQSSISVERRSCVSVEVDILDLSILKGDDKGKRENTKDWSDGTTMFPCVPSCVPSGVEGGHSPMALHSKKLSSIKMKINQGLNC